MVSSGHKEDPTREKITKFALMIQQIQTPKGDLWRFETENQGISAAEILLRIESWLVTEKELFKKHFNQG